MNGRQSITFICVTLALAAGTAFFALKTHREAEEVRAMSREVESQIAAKLDSAQAQVAATETAIGKESETQRIAMLARLKRASGELASLRASGGSETRISALETEIRNLQAKIAEIDHPVSPSTSAK
tara:strand:- start:32792 stop:33172 length:381 start_codon:yes stop_codon:yes gene_type:complete